ncbi:MAG: carbohydrate kinase family protein [Oscillospiraceae bacterium]|nr:carbohydrate kinase family protein [Oscillospiraceae bacterium]
MNRGIACLGNLIVDVIKEIDSYPQAGNLATVRSVSQTTGGLVPNCLMDLAKMDPAFHLEAVGLLGKDEYGEYIRKALECAGIDSSHIGTHPALSTSFTDVMDQSGGGERTFFHYRGANAAFCPEHIPLRQIQADILHFGYILLLDSLDQPDSEYGTALARVLCDAQNMGFKTSIDVVSEQGERFNRLMPPALKYADYCIINEIEAAQTVNIPCRDGSGNLLRKNMEPICRALKAMGVREWAVVHCPEGAFAVDKQGDYFTQTSLNLPKAEIKGKTGAGDAFCAATLYGAYKEMPLPKTLKLASAAAAACLTARGAAEGLRTEKALWEMAERYGFQDDSL